MQTSRVTLLPEPWVPVLLPTAHRLRPTACQHASRCVSGCAVTHVASRWSTSGTCFPVLVECALSAHGNCGWRRNGSRNVSYELPATSYCLLTPVRLKPDTTYWTLATGYQLPATSYWLPPTGYRLPATNVRPICATRSGTASTSASDVLKLTIQARSANRPRMTAFEKNA
jgi:hypothetical protein